MTLQRRPTYLARADRGVGGLEPARLSGTGEVPASELCGGQGFAYRVDTVEVQQRMESILAPLGLWDEIDPTPSS